MIIDTLVKRDLREVSQGNEPLLDHQRLLKVALKFYDKHLFEHQIAQGLEAALGPSSVTYGYRIGKKG